MKHQVRKRLLILLSLLLVFTCFMPEALAEKKHSEKTTVTEQIAEKETQSKENCRKRKLNLKGV